MKNRYSQMPKTPTARFQQNRNCSNQNPIFLISYNTHTFFCLSHMIIVVSMANKDQCMVCVFFLFFSLAMMINVPYECNTFSPFRIISLNRIQVFWIFLVIYLFDKYFIQLSKTKNQIKIKFKSMENVFNHISIILFLCNFFFILVKVIYLQNEEK